MTPHVHEPSPAPSPAPEDASEPLPGIPFDKRVCRCTECGRLVTAHSSVERGCGPTCFAKAQGDLYQRQCEAQGQQRFAWAEDAGARA